MISSINRFHWLESVGGKRAVNSLVWSMVSIEIVSCKLASSVADIILSDQIPHSRKRLRVRVVKEVD